MITLYGITSPYAFRVRSALMRKALPFEAVSVNLAAKSEEFLKLTPIGKIPVLQDSDGTVVVDSRYIVQYLDRKYPDTYNMTGETLQEYAEITKMLAWVDKVADITPPLTYEVYGLFERSGKLGMARRGVSRFDDEQKASLREELALQLTRIADALGSGTYLAASRFTIADAALLTLIRSLTFCKEPVPERLTAYFEEHMKDPVTARMFPSPDEKPAREI